METRGNNLTRKWRSRGFSGIIGQELVVKILKNSLYKGAIFPLYLFSGQRGCGKTTTARIFAAAVNCTHLEDFRAKPQQTALPCELCPSCIATFSGKHPDFIEMDAASHNGVESAREVIDSAALLPVMSRHKVYLIDEAHMLSKAAFNAFLKVLEEPPADVLFILATTDPQKIIETVRSRSLQLLFKPLPQPILQSYLKQVCTEEKIYHDEAGISLIVDTSEGSVRDALNMIEQVRYSGDGVSADAVRQLLRIIDDSLLISLLEVIFLKGTRSLLSFLDTHEISRFDLVQLVKRFSIIVQHAIWLAYGVQPKANLVSELHASVRQLLRVVTVHDLHYLLTELLREEIAIGKTGSPYSYFVAVLVRISQKYDNNDGSGSSSGAALEVSISPVSLELLDEGEEEEDAMEEEAMETRSWQEVVKQISSLDDPLLVSIFTHGSLVKFDAATGIATVEFLEKFSFFSDLIRETKSTWLPLVARVFPRCREIIPLFTKKDSGELSSKIQQSGSEQPRQRVALAERAESTKLSLQKAVSTEKTMSVGKPAKAPYTPHKGARSRGGFAAAQKPREILLDVSDKNKWKRVHQVLRYFPGKVTEIRNHV